ncbi:MAG: DNA repair protein RecN [Terriglobia bacterium]
MRYNKLVTRHGSPIAVFKMLREIHIQNYAVVESLNLEFFPGLNILSGETGSGKSILVDALGLALGGRASPDVVRSGRERATVTAVFQSEPPAPWAGWTEEYGLSGGNENEIILRREILAEGKSRLLVNDQPVTLAAVRNLAHPLADLLGQNEHVALLEEKAQLDLLDEFGGISVEEVAALFRRRRELGCERAALSQSEQERLRTLDLLQFQAKELSQARLSPGEDARLEEEKRLLANVEKLRAAASTAFANLYEEEGSVCSRLSLVTRSLEELCRYNASISPQIEPLGSARAALEDLATFLRDYLGKLEADPERLEEIEDRLAHIDRLKRKYGKTIEEILAYSAQTEANLARLEHADERRTELTRELEEASAKYRRTAEAVSAQRRAAAKALEKSVRQELTQLGMEKTRFEIRFVPHGEGGEKGIDTVEMLISPNPGEEPRPLARVASGGELSRLMLALKTAENGAEGAASSRRKQPAAAQRTLVFDEVDAGIGGRVAECVGRRLKRLARAAQVLSVTHLPQIACFADHHYVVEKFERGGRVFAEVKYLRTRQERAAELARMLSGSQITSAVLEHAAIMLKGAEQTT